MAISCDVTVTEPGRDATATSADQALLDQPIKIVERDGVRYTLLGTAHISQASVNAVRALIASQRFDTVAVELDSNRHRALTGSDTLNELDLFAILRGGKAGLVAANLALAAYQRRLAEQLGIEPGAELKAACSGADDAQLRLWLIDRDIGITLRRAWNSLGWWSRAKLASGLGASLLFDSTVEQDEIERLKEGDLLESSFGEFARQSPPLFTALIDERDHYMAARLREHSVPGDAREVLAVVGAGHLHGLAQALQSDHGEPTAMREELDSTPASSQIPWFTIGLIAFLLGGFAWGFARGDGLGMQLAVGWVLTTGTLGALGCLVAGGHPLSVLAAFFASPLTPLHPALSSGMVSAGVEAWLRKPTYRDFLYLRDDTLTLKGWWRNRVARVMVNFFLTNLGTALGVWIAGAAILGKLI
ncbi:MAG: conjugal transfer protein TraB [Lysobacterales bacterium CG_4_10_14_3_um_filter_64_11]|nr:MAG: conjugal transfer protein TraB [Xanthomonadales bacterium CG_4_10_14_3_um_filter_64_11]